LTDTDVVTFATRAIEVTILLSMPILMTSLVVGVVISLLQSVTQIQEQTLSFVPKLIAVMIVFLLTLPWALDVLGRFVTETFQSFPNVVR
jgi:flagellar biosynthetic protein FliQ